MGDRMFRRGAYTLVYSPRRVCGHTIRLVRRPNRHPNGGRCQFSISKPIGTIILLERLYSGFVFYVITLKLHSTDFEGLSVGQGGVLFGNTY